jgi:hypothetical protein
MGRSIVESIERDHRRLLEITARLSSVSRGQQRLGNQLRTLCIGHLRAETAVACRVVGHAGYAATEQQARRILDALAAGDNEPRLHIELRTWLTDHITDVRHLVIPRLGAESGRSRLEQLGAAYQRRRVVEAAALRAVRGTPRRLDRSRTELYEQARRAGIAGRSAMTRRELVNALQQGAARVVPGEISAPSLFAGPGA